MKVCVQICVDAGGGRPFESGNFRGVCPILNRATKITSLFEFAIPDLSVKSYGYPEVLDRLWTSPVLKRNGLKHPERCKML